MDSDLREIKKMLEGLEHRISKLESAKNDSIITPRIDQSLGEFLKLYRVKSIVETTLVIGYYLQINRGYESFNIYDIDKCFKDELLKKPKNINDMVNKNIAKTLLTRSDEEKDSQTAWKLTKTGFDSIDERLKEINPAN